MVYVRRLVFTNGYYYHVYNRGVAKQPVFLNKRDYLRFVLTLNYYRFADQPFKLSRFLTTPVESRNDIRTGLGEAGKCIVSILSWCLMPNHFHLLLRQEQDNGVSSYLSKITNSYTKYHNTINERTGSLFQGVFKAVLIEDDEQLMHVSRYIHLNPVSSSLVSQEKIENYHWSSYLDYLGKRVGFVDSRPVMSLFKSTASYQKFVLDHADYAKRLEQMKHLILE